MEGGWVMNTLAKHQTTEKEKLPVLGILLAGGVGGGIIGGLIYFQGYDHGIIDTSIEETRLCNERMSDLEQENRNLKKQLRKVQGSA